MIQCIKFYKNLYDKINVRKGILIKLQGGENVIVSSNVAVLNSFNKVTKNKGAKNELVEKISSGKRINRAADDAAGLSISESIKAQVRGMSMAEKNIQDGISLIQVADGAMGEITKNLHRMKELSVQASNDTLTDKDRGNLEDELTQLKHNIDTIASETEFNGIKILKEDRVLTLQVKDSPYTTYELQLFNVTTGALGIEDISVALGQKAQKANFKVDEALNKITGFRTSLGSDLNNLQHSFSDASNSGSNLTAALSGIEDINMATALMRSVKERVMLDCNESMLTAARQNNDNVNVVLNKWLS